MLKLLDERGLSAASDRFLSCVDIIARSWSALAIESAKEPAFTHYDVCSKLNFEFYLDISRAQRVSQWQPVVNMDEGDYPTAA